MLGIKLDVTKWVHKQFHDDWVDRLNYFYTVFILLVFQIVVTAKQMVGNPIECWLPAEFPKYWEQYAETYCFASNTYYLPYDQKIPVDIRDRDYRKISYYQWVPVVLLFQALLFYTPNLIWKWLSGMSGLNIKSLTKLVTDAFAMLECDKREKSIPMAARSVMQSLRVQSSMSKRTTCGSLCCSWCGVDRCRWSGNYLCCMYIVLKVLNCVNVVAQFFFVDAFLGANEWFLGGRILIDYIRGVEWAESGRFPRVTLCDFQVRDWAPSTKQRQARYTIQCVLVINMWIEKIYVLLWCWMIFVAICSFWNLIGWVHACFCSTSKQRLIKKYLKAALVDLHGCDFGDGRVVEKFVRDGLTSDGVLLIRFMSGHAGDMVTTDLISLMFQKCWSILARNYPTEGAKVRYRCSVVKSRGPQCPAQICLLYHADRNSVSLFRTEDDHDHQGKLSTRGLHPDTRQAVMDLYEKGVKAPRQILFNLRKDGKPEPHGQQLTNFLQLYKKTHLGQASMENAGEFEDWCKQHSIPSPENPDASFVLRYWSGINPEGKASIRLFITMLRLLGFASKSNILHADGTYKNNRERLPTIMIGTSDRDGHYHPFGIGLSSGETEEDYAFMFEAIAHGVDSFCGIQYKPEVLVADAAPAITNGFASVFGNGFRRVTCWFHVKKNIKDQAKPIAKDKRKRIIDDVDELQLCPSIDIFNAATRLFFEKWRLFGDPKINKFLVEFYKQWIKKNSGWFEGFVQYAPSTNNCLEATNNAIKRYETLRSRLPLPQYLNLIRDAIVHKWSVERNSDLVNAKNFMESPKMTTQLWTISHQFASESRRILVKARGDGWRDYFVPADGHLAVFGPALVHEYNAAFTNLQWRSFNDYARLRNRLWVVSIFNDEWRTAICNCSDFLKKNVCCHSVGVAIRIGFCNAPAVAKTIPIGQKRKRGRPRLATAALMRD